VTIVLSASGSSGSVAQSFSFAFNTIGCIALLLPVLGVILGLLGNFVFKKSKLVAFISFALILAGTIMVFFVLNGYALANSTDDYKIDVGDYKWGATYIITVVCYILATLGSGFGLLTSSKK
jgi:hypothetical protein